MGQTTGVNVAQRAYDVDISPQFDGYSAVRIYVGTDEKGDAIVYEAGDTTGRTLEVKNDFGTQQMAQDILDSILGYQYQPLTASNALLDPAAEMGDGVSVNGVYTGLYLRATNFGRLMASDIAAPTDQELAHEYASDISASDRAFSRFVASTRSAISLTSTEITAEVTRATAAEESLSAQITESAESITATVTEVSGKVDGKLDHTHTNSEFGWTLTSNSFSINSNNSQNIFYADKDGIKIQGNAEVSGKITATSGYIGGSTGFTITATSIYNGKSSFSGIYNKAGVYIGVDGIALGSKKSGENYSKFQVDANGNLHAENADISGNVDITGGSISINGGRFYVDAAGNLTANTGTFAGNVYAKNISYGTDLFDGTNYGYFNGGGLATGTVTGGMDYWNQPTGALGYNTVAYGNTSFRGTLDQVDTNASNIYYLSSRISDVELGFFNTVNATNVSCSGLYLGGYIIYVGSDGIVRGSRN